ncbi:Probable lipid phosphate phosphatase beta [Linum perenne]
MAAGQPLLRHVIALDAAISLFLHKLFHPFFPTAILILLEISADFRFSFPVCLALLLSPLSPPLLPLFSPLLLGLLLDLAVVGLTKSLFRRARPSYNHSSMSAVVAIDHYSFPSGHSTRVFFVASLISLSAAVIQSALIELKAAGGLVERWIIGERVVENVVIGVYVWAAITASSRVFLGRHFFFDVVAGACLGVAEGYVAFWYLRIEDFLRYFALPESWRDSKLIAFGFVGSWVRWG